MDNRLIIFAIFFIILYFVFNKRESLAVGGWRRHHHHGGWRRHHHGGHWGRHHGYFYRRRPLYYRGYYSYDPRFHENYSTKFYNKIHHINQYKPPYYYHDYIHYY